MKELTFSKSDIKTETVYAGGNVRIAYAGTVWAAVLQHIAYTDCTTAHLLQSQLFPTLPLAAVETLVQELETDGYIKRDYGTDLNTEWFLTPKGQADSLKGKYDHPLPEDKVVKMEVADLGPGFGTFVLDAWVEDRNKGLIARAVDTLQNTEFEARNGKDCIANVVVANFYIKETKQKHEQKSRTGTATFTLNDIGAHVKWMPNGSEPGKRAKQLDATGTLAPFKNYLAQGVRGYDIDKQVVLAELTDMHLQELKQFPDEVPITKLNNQPHGWRLHPFQLKQVPANANSAQIAYICELANRLTQQPAVPEANAFQNTAEVLRGKLEKKWEFPLQTLTREAMLGAIRPAKTNAIGWGFSAYTPEWTPAALRTQLAICASSDLNSSGQNSQPQTGHPEPSLDTIFPLAQVTTWIQQAQAMICVQSYLLQETVLWNAIRKRAKEGVRVYVVTSNTLLAQDAKSLDKDFRLDDYKALLADAAQWATLRESPTAHAKYLLVDPAGPTPRGVFSTGNFTDRGLITNDERYVTLTPAQCRTLHGWFSQAFWAARKEQAPSKVFNPTGSKLEQPQAVVVNPQGETSPLWAHLAGMLNQPDAVSIRIGLYRLDATHPFVSILEERSKTGVQVRLEVPEIENDLHKRLEECGIQIAIRPNLHAKYLEVGTKKGYCERCVFSANWDAASHGNPLEMGVDC